MSDYFYSLQWLLTNNAVWNNCPEEFSSVSSFIEVISNEENT